MIFKQRTRPISKTAFRYIAKECAKKDLLPTLAQSFDEICLHYNHPAGLPKRMICLLGRYQNKQVASAALDNLYEILEEEISKTKENRG